MEGAGDAGLTPSEQTKSAQKTQATWIPVRSIEGGMHTVPVHGVSASSVPMAGNAGDHANPAALVTFAPNNSAIFATASASNPTSTKMPRIGRFMHGVHASPVAGFPALPAPVMGVLCSP